MKNIVVIGATSAIAEATCRLYAARGDRLFLLARDRERLARIQSDLRIRGAAAVDIRQLDVNNLDDHEPAIGAAFDELGHVDALLIAHGTLPVQGVCERDVNVALTELRTNGISTVSLLTLIANRMEQQRSGTIGVITSVAGERGRQSNYVYGAAKSLVSTFLQGLRNRLHRYGVRVTDIRPGFVDTPMTAAFDKGPLWASPESVAHRIVAAVDKGKSVVYTPGFWRIIMFAVRNIPEPMFKQLRL